MSAALYEAAAAFLEADVPATLNQEQPGLLAPGAVTVARPVKQRLARRDVLHKATVEIVLVRRREEAEGIASDRVFLDFDLHCVLRVMDRSEGREQARLVDDVARALVRRYRRRADLAVPVVGATFRWVDAHLLHVDDEPAPRKGDFARAVVRVVFLFSEALA